jgi:hypothetical protein
MFEWCLRLVQYQHSMWSLASGFCSRRRSINALTTILKLITEHNFTLTKVPNTVFSYYTGLLFSLEGHKTTYGLISNEPQYPPSHTMADMKKEMLTSGPICRYASDLRLLVEVQAGSRFTAAYKQKFHSKVDLRQIKYYVITDYNECLVASKLSDASKNAVNKVCGLFRNFFFD